MVSLGKFISINSYISSVHHAINVENSNLSNYCTLNANSRNQFSIPCSFSDMGLSVDYCANKLKSHRIQETNFMDNPTRVFFSYAPIKLPQGLDCVTIFIPQKAYNKKRTVREIDDVYCVMKLTDRKNIISHMEREEKFYLNLLLAAFWTITYTFGQKARKREKIIFLCTNTLTFHNDCSRFRNEGSSGGGERRERKK